MNMHMRPCSVAVLAFVAGAVPAFADVLNFTNTCATGNWFSACEGKPCDGGLLIFNNWGRSNCGGAPQLPGMADTADIGANLVEASGVPGGMIVAGQLVVPAGGTLNLLDTGVHTLGGSILGDFNVQSTTGVDIRGELELLGRTTFHGIANFQDAAAWTNAGEFEVSSGALSTLATGAFVNNGLYRKTAGSTVTSYLDFSNSGEVRVEGGILELHNRVRSAEGARWETLPGTFLRFQSADLQGRFDVQNAGGTRIRDCEIGSLGAAFHVPQGGLVIAGNLLIRDAGQLMNEAGGVLRFATGYTISGSVPRGTATIINRGHADVGASGAIHDVNILNEGSWTFANNAGFTSDNYLDFTNTGALTFAQTGAVTMPRIINSGTIRLESGAVSLAGNFTQSAGELRADGGTMENGGVYLYGGSFSGGGVHGALMYNVGGMVEPGDPVGLLDLGYYYQGEGGALHIEIASRSEFDRINSDGVHLDGALRVTLVNGFQPADGDVFRFITSTGRGGGFTSLDLPPGFSVIYTGSQARLIYATPCHPDFNNDGTLNSADFFDFLAAFFAGDASADFNEDAVVDSRDFFDFLSLFFEGC